MNFPEMSKIYFPLIKQGSETQFPEMAATFDRFFLLFDFWKKKNSWPLVFQQIYSWK